MEIYALVVISTYLFAIYLLSLRAKVSHNDIRSFKLILLAMIVFVVYLLITTKETGIALAAQIVAFVPLIYVAVMTYINELKYLLRQFSKKPIRKLRISKINNDLAAKLIETVEFLSNRQIGALITVEREVSLTPFITKALEIDAPVSSELLASIFIPTTPLHDGAVIIRGNTILCAKAYYPASQRTDLPMHYGTRHRAAIGISEQSDALTIVVSEETGHVSLAVNRQLDYNVSIETLHLYFEKYLKMK